MIRLPVFQHITVSDYGLFPGHPMGAGINRSFTPGLTLIAGVNGLGKTTLLTMILRAFTGPYDLTGDGAPGSLGVVIPEKPTELRGRAITFFQQRVAQIAGATVTLTYKIGEAAVVVQRRLDDLSLQTFKIDGDEQLLSGPKHDRERHFQQAIAELMGVSGFVDVLLLLHHLILFHEDRPGALWDPNAQRQVLRALFLDRIDAEQVANLERLLQGADSQARNIQTRITATMDELRETRRKEAGSEGIVAQLQAEQKLLDADLAEIDRLNALLAEADETRQQTRLEVERAKVEREDASGAVERLKYTALLRLFPTMDDAARLIVSRIMTESKCLVCESDAQEKRIELESLIAAGCCPACGAPPEAQENVHPQHEFEQAKLDQARERLELTRREEDSASQRLKSISEIYKTAFDRLMTLRRSANDRKDRDQRLRGQLPRNTTSTQLEATLETLKIQQQDWLGRRAEYFESLKILLERNEERITSKSAELMVKFQELCQELLSEEARLAVISSEPKYLQAPGKAEDRLRVPAYAAEMTAANRPGFVRRNSPSDVSESQRELIDLAFRLALVKAATGGGSCTFVMETPEASLDGLAMERVGRALVQFANEGQNRLIVTSNLTNSGLITALLGGPTREHDEIVQRKDRIINLLDIAAPNRAVVLDGAQYKKLLADAISGEPDAAI